MKYGIFSDVHANLEAFNAVVAALKNEDLDGYVFLGDIVGYGADPKKCLELLRELIDKSNCQCIAGNHDHAVCGLTDTTHYNKNAKISIEWTEEQLDDDEIDFLLQIPLMYENESFAAVHANLIAPKDWGYILDIDDAHENFKKLKQQICFIGHSHFPIIFVQSKGVEVVYEEVIPIKSDEKIIVNVGSVGQPRDGNPKASFALLDLDRHVVEIRRIDYDIESAQKKIIKAGLPSELAGRLSIGK